MKLPRPRELAERLGRSQEGGTSPGDQTEIESGPECIVGRVALPVARRVTDETERIVDAFLREQATVSGPVARVVRAGGNAGLKLVGINGESLDRAKPDPEASTSDSSNR